MVNELNLKVMPTRKELETFFGNSQLGNAITRRFGWYELAKELGLQIKDSDTTLGKEYEYKIKEKLEEIGYQVIKMKQNYPYDLLVDGVKIDVKVSNIGHYNIGSFYSFRIGKDYSTCDIYIFVAINDDGGESIYIIPSVELLNNVQVSVGGKTSKYDKYIDRFDILDRYIKFNKDILK